MSTLLLPSCGEVVCECRASHVMAPLFVCIVAESQIVMMMVAGDPGLAGDDGPG